MASWIFSLIAVIVLLVFVYFARETYDMFETIMKVFGTVVIPVGLIILFGVNVTIPLTIVDRIIQTIGIGLCLLLLNFSYDENCFTFASGWALICFIAFIFLSGGLFVDEMTKNNNEEGAQKKIVSRIEWDYSNPQIATTEYMIVGTSNETIIVNVSYNGENTLRSIPFSEISVKYDESTLKPYVYRENTIYTEYDYGKNPPEALRKDSSTWSKYILCGTQKQIQGLFGYEETFNFEQ